MISAFPTRISKLSKNVTTLKWHITVGNFKQVVRKIKDTKNSADAQAIYDLIINHDEPSYWLALIQNPFLLNELSWRSLQTLLLKADNLLEEAQTDPVLFKIGMTLAQSVKICGKINHTDFIKFTQRNSELALYIAGNPEFIRHLDHQAIEEFFTFCPHLAENILNSLQKINQSNKANQAWFVSALEWIVTHSQVALWEMQKHSKKYAHFISLLKKSFLQRPYFATEVLKRLAVCRLLKVPTDDAIKHPFLTGTNFWQIGLFFMRVNNMAHATGYLLLALEKEQFYAALSLATLVREEDSTEAWDWLTFAMKKLPKNDPKLIAATLEFYEFLREKDDPLADSVLAHLPVKDFSLDELMEKLEITEDTMPLALSEDDTSSASYLPTYISSVETAKPTTEISNEITEMFKRKRSYLFD